MTIVDKGGGGVLVKEFMSNRLAYLQPRDTLRQAIRLFRTTRLEGAPVVDGEGRVTGIFTKSILFDSLLDDRDLDEPVSKFMNQQVVTVSPNVSFAQISEQVRRTNVGQAVVATEDGLVVGMLTKVDIIRALLEHNDFLSSELGGVVNAMYNGVVAIDRNGRVTLINPAAERLLGVRAAELVGRPVEEVWPESGLLEILRSGTAEVGCRRVLGSSVVITNCTPIAHGEQIIGALAIIHDLTEYEAVATELESVKKLSHTLDTILELAYDGIIVVDEAGRVTMVNNALVQFIGRSRDQIIGKHVSEVLENSRLHEVARTGIPEIGQVQVIRGTPFIVSRLPIIEDGRVVGAVGKVMFRGLAELKEMARRLENLENQLDFYREQLTRVSGARYTLDNIISSNHLMQRLKVVARQAARSTSTVLLLGESGTGKELFAHAIHYASPRRSMPFVKVNCAAVPENLLESEFFGYADGAFTGAKKGGKPGKFELADGGTIFLDEVGDMAPALQAKLLRVLQDRELERVGGTETIRVDVRIIAASNKDLARMVADGLFREDLYYRLNVVTMVIPPLRERKEDILPLVHHLIEKYNHSLGVRVKGIAPDALAALQEYGWPGNVRELENVIERAMNLDVGDLIGVEHLPGQIAAAADAAGESAAEPAGDSTGEPGRPPARRAGRGTALKQATFRQAVADAERQAIASALAASGGNKARAARMLGMSRSQFYEKLKKLEA